MGNYCYLCFNCLWYQCFYWFIFQVWILVSNLSSNEWGTIIRSYFSSNRSNVDTNYNCRKSTIWFMFRNSYNYATLLCRMSRKRLNQYLLNEFLQYEIRWYWFYSEISLWKKYSYLYMYLDLYSSSWYFYRY